MLLEFTPGLLFFLAHQHFDFDVATLVLVTSTLFCVLTGFKYDHIPVFPIIAVVLILVLAGLGFYFDDESFIKLKTTIGKLLFALILLGGLSVERTILQRALDKQITLPRKGWVALTCFWSSIAVAFAVLNEIVWRNMSTDNWVIFNVIITPASIFCYVIITHTTVRWWKLNYPITSAECRP